MGSENDKRTERAWETLASYCQPDGEDRSAMIVDARRALTDRAELFDEVVSDLICDLTHLATNIGHTVDWPALVDRGLTHFWEEN